MTRYLLLLLPLLATGCQTTVGNYFANRGRDLGECFLVQAGLTMGLGVDVKVAGIAHLDALMLAYFGEGTVGWLYGEARPAKVCGLTHLPADGDYGLGFVHFSGTSIGGCGRGHRCFAVLPAILSWGDLGWIWGDLDKQFREVWGTIEHWPEGLDSEKWFAERRAEIRGARRWSQVHVFDIEAGVCVLLLGARAGFSPGEFLDFLLGWVGIDIAGDDWPLVEPEEEQEAPLIRRSSTPRRERSRKEQPLIPAVPELPQDP